MIQHPILEAKGGTGLGLGSTNAHLAWRANKKKARK